jgi:hypothetical protein
MIAHNPQKYRERRAEAIWSYQPRCGVTFEEMILITWQDRLQAVIRMLLWLMVLAIALWGSHRLAHMALVHIAHGPVPLPAGDQAPLMLFFAAFTFITAIPMSTYAIFKEAQYLRPRPRIIGYNYSFDP